MSRMGYGELHPGRSNEPADHVVLVLVLAVGVGVATIRFARHHPDIMTSRETFSDQLNPGARGDSVRTE